MLKREQFDTRPQVHRDAFILQRPAPASREPCANQMRGIVASFTIGPSDARKDVFSIADSDRLRVKRADSDVFPVVPPCPARYDIVGCLFRDSEIRSYAF